MFRLLLAVTLLLHLNTLAQIDSKKVDSLARVIDSSAKANREQQESVIRSTDSNYQSELNKTLQRDSGNFSTEQKRKEERKRQQFIVRIWGGVLLLLIAVLALVHKNKRNP
jgi:hypothetical protein